MVAQAAGKPGWSDVRFVQHDLNAAMPFANASFDRVVSFLVLDHITALDVFFAECRRVCRPEGFVLISVMHPAMMLRGIQARFKDPATGLEVRPASATNTISDYVLAATRAGLRIDHMSEHAVDAELAARMERAAKYLDWPMLLLMKIRG
jgi:malonyl-CoA O-methyltransferase